jgi:hypothetical protein
MVTERLAFKSSGTPDVSSCPLGCFLLHYFRSSFLILRRLHAAPVFLLPHCTIEP